MSRPQQLPHLAEPTSLCWQSRDCHPWRHSSKAGETWGSQPCPQSSLPAPTISSGKCAHGRFWSKVAPKLPMAPRTKGWIITRKENDYCLKKPSQVHRNLNRYIVNPKRFVEGMLLLSRVIHVVALDKSDKIAPREGGWSKQRLHRKPGPSS